VKKSPIVLVAALGIVLGVVASTALTAVATSNSKPAAPPGGRPFRRHRGRLEPGAAPHRPDAR
jgi:hypothetical protein